jgi:hypothetical protein
MCTLAQSMARVSRPESFDPAHGVNEPRPYGRGESCVQAEEGIVSRLLRDGALPRFLRTRVEPRMQHP